MPSFKNPLGVERIVIEIDPQTAEYSADFQSCHPLDIVRVLKDLLARLENGLQNEESISMTNDSGEELTSDERESYFRDIRDIASATEPDTKKHSRSN